MTGAKRAHRHGAPKATRLDFDQDWISTMPSLFRFLIFVGLLGGLGYGAVFALANFVQHKPREMVVTVPQDKFLKPPR
jgi:bacteriorhodopsin